MDNFELAGMSISIEASPPRIQTAISAMFQMLNKTDHAADIHLIGQGFYGDEIYSHLPIWLKSKINYYTLDIEPEIFRGPDNQIAAAGAISGLISCAWMSPQKNEIQFLCSMKKSETSIALFQPVLVPILREVFINKNYFLLHSAAVLSPNGLGFLIIAPSGGGKSTTALSLVRKGAKLLGDDLVLLQISNDGNTAFGIPEPMNLTDITMNLFDETKRNRDIITPRPGYVKKSVLPQQLFGPSCMIRSCHIHIVYFIHVSETGPSVRPLNIGESLKRLLLSHAFSNNQEINPYSVSQFCSFLENVDAYALNTGPDPIELGKWLINSSSKHLTKPVVS